MENDAKRRLNFAREVSDLLRSEGDFRQWLAFTNKLGEKPIVIALPEDTLGGIFDRIEAAYPEGANVLVPKSTVMFHNLVVRNEDVGTVPFGEHDDDCPVHPESTVAMLLAYMETRNAGSLRCASVVPDFSLQVGPDFSLQPV